MFVKSKVEKELCAGKSKLSIVGWHRTYNIQDQKPEDKGNTCTDY